MESNTNLSKENFSYITFLRVFAGLAVVGIHTVCTPVYLHPEAYSSVGLYFSILINNTLRSFAVPIFIMISGALMLNPQKELPLKKLITKNFLRLIYALVIFTFIFCFMEEFFTERKITVSGLLHVLRNMIEGKSWNHMWYLYALPGLYLLIPLFRSFVKNSDDKGAFYLLIVLFIFTCLFPFITKLTSIEIGLKFPIVSIWVLYFLMGYYIHSEKIKIPLVLDIILIIIPVLYILIAGFIPALQLPGADLKFTENNSLCAVCLSVGIFSLTKKLYVRENSKLTLILSQLIFGTYLIHAVFINIFYKILKFNPANMNLIVMWLIVFLGSFILSAVITYCLRLIKPVRKYIL